MKSELPLVYSCSGCSNAAQLANAIALRLDRKGIAEWSCIAGVGGDVKPLVKIARSGRSIIAIDGCPLACVKHCLARHEVAPTVHYRLQEHGVRKQAHVDFDPQQADELAQMIAAEIHAAEAQIA
ncbi:MAG TPA: putative zinc-binding protein [Burkholderiales bacterium]|jgi:uncharacterized metal-binding protein|nr:putative zinc-binding protein [Burkholderiales bacterium]